MTDSSPEHQVILDDLPGLLSGELAPHRERQVVGHLDNCDACRRELATIAKAAAWLKDAARLNPDPDQDLLALPPLQLPRHAMFARLRRPPNRVHGAPHPRRSLTAAAALLLVVAVGAAGVIVGRTSNTTSGNPTVVALRPLPGGVVPIGKATGKAELRPSGGMHLTVRGLPRLDAQNFYEVWLTDPPTGRMLAVGVLPDSGVGDYSLPRDAERGYGTVDISLQPNDGNPQYSKLNVLHGTINS